jgi:hypothetical protein
LDRAQWRAGGGHAGAEGVAQLAERQVLGARGGDGSAEALAERFDASRTWPVSGWAKTRSRSPRQASALEVAFELAREPVAHRNTPSAVRLRRVERAAGVALGHSHAVRDPVNVAPAEADQLALAKTRHRRGEVERAFDGSQVVVWNSADDCGEVLA